MELYNVSSSPHLKTKQSVSGIMLDVCIALIPASIVGVIVFGVETIFTIAVSILSAVISEYIVNRIRKTKTTINDFSAVVTGILLALNLPPNIPLWIPIVGSAVSVILVKQLFGGIGQNFMNPAMAGRAFLVVSYPKLMTTFIEPFSVTVSSATPLAVIQSGNYENLRPIMDTFLGTVPGVIGETSALALLVGGLYLIFRKIITWHIPTIYISSIFLLTMIFNGFDLWYSTYSIISGGVLLGGFFMLTDYSSSPASIKGKYIFALGAGIITFVIRQFGAYTEGVMFSVLLMNITMPIIESYFPPKIFGKGGKQ